VLYKATPLDLVDVKDTAGKKEFTAYASTFGNEDLGGDIDGTTWGWGIALPAGDFGGVRYDGARFPVSRSSGLDDHIRHGVQVWLDPWAIARGMKPRSI